MSRHQNRLYLNISNIEIISVLQELDFIFNIHFRKFIELKKYPAAKFPGQIFTFRFSDIQFCTLKNPLTIFLYGTDMVRIEVRKKNLLYGRWRNIEPAHFFFQTLIIIAGINHDGFSIFRIKVNIGNPLPNSRHSFVNPACI